MAAQEAVKVEISNGTEEDLRLCANVDGTFLDWDLPAGSSREVETTSALSVTLVGPGSPCPV